MNDNEIIKALECCKVCSSPEDCYECPYGEGNTKRGCVGDLINDSLEFINRLQADAEMYKDLYEELKSEHLETIRRIKSVKSEARKEFAERLIGKYAHYRLNSELSLDAFVCDIKHLLKELDGKENSDER